MNWLLLIKCECIFEMCKRNERRFLFSPLIQKCWIVNMCGECVCFILFLLIKAYMIHHTHCVHTIIFIFFRLYFVLASSIFSIFCTCTPWVCEALIWAVCILYIRFIYKMGTKNDCNHWKKGGKFSHTRLLIGFKIFSSISKNVW